MPVFPRMNRICQQIFLTVILSGCLLDTTNQLVQMDIRQLKEEYPELMNFLYSTSEDTSLSMETTEKTTDFTSEEPSTTLPTPSDTTKNAFIYYNATTKILEGISMQSTYSIFKLNPYKIFTLITTTSFPLYTPSRKTSRKILTQGSTSLIPLYHQFIYSINLFNYLPSVDRIKDLSNLLNEQTPHSSKIRVHILKAISQQLKIPPTSLRINWIEKLHKNETAEQLPYENILISMSSVYLLDMQNSYSTALTQKNEAKITELDFAYEKECTEYFTFLKAIHQRNEFDFNINFLELVYPAETFFTNDKNNLNYERVDKVQLLKLCNLKKIYSILSLNDNDDLSDTNQNRLLPKQLKLANSLIKRSTEEIKFSVNESTQEEELILSTTTSRVSIEEKEDSQVISFKSDSIQNVSRTLNVTDGGVLWYKEYGSQLQNWFWGLVPEEDFLLAVVVPAIILISLIVFTIVTVCLLQMCNKDYKEAKRAKKMGSLSNTTDVSAVPSNLDKTNRTANFKERAYLSKGVPVILYEEMSEKPIDDYDENNRDIMDNGCETIKTYRSPLIMRNEKPPMPAPPEYSRSDYVTRKPEKDYTHEKQDADIQVIVNELNEETTMLIVNKNKRMSGGLNKEALNA